MRTAVVLAEEQRRAGHGSQTRSSNQIHQAPAHSEQSDAQEPPGSREDFLATLTHELRSPVAAMAMNVDVLLRDFEQIGAHETLAILQRIQRSAIWLQTMIDNLAVAAQTDNRPIYHAWRAIRIRDCVDTVAALIGPWVERRHQQIRPEVPADLVVRADRQSVERILLNLLMNAHKYGSPDSVIRLSAGRRGDWARVQIDNAGAGVAPEEQERIFQRFTQGTAASEVGGAGLGLGLHIVKTMVERQGGHVGVESMPGQGASFWFSLPLWSRDDGSASALARECESEDTGS